MESDQVAPFQRTSPPETHAPSVAAKVNHDVIVIDVEMASSVEFHSQSKRNDEVTDLVASTANVAAVDSLSSTQLVTHTDSRQVDNKSNRSAIAVPAQTGMLPSASASVLLASSTWFGVLLRILSLLHCIHCLCIVALISSQPVNDNSACDVDAKADSDADVDDTVATVAITVAQSQLVKLYHFHEKPCDLNSKSAFSLLSLACLVLSVAESQPWTTMLRSCFSPLAHHTEKRNCDMPNCMHQLGFNSKIGIWAERPTMYRRLGYVRREFV